MYLLTDYCRKIWAWTAFAMLFSTPVFAESSSLAITDTGSEQFVEFVEEQLQTKMKEHKIAGTTLAIVHKGSMIYAQGFGFSDITQNIPVNAEQTLFRWGSVSKTVTWTAIMQLVEQGKISLDADINDYLKDVHIPNTFKEPIRVRDLLSHTAGFEDLILGHLFEKDAAQVLTLTDYLNRYQPKRMRAAGELFSYSNYSTALAGQIIANVSQMSFEDYVEKHIFIPLQMRQSTFREPLPPRFEERMQPALIDLVSKSFTPNQNGFSQIDHFTFISGVGPAGSMSATVTDMAKFAKAQLQECSGLLMPQTCSRMRQPLFSMTSANDVTINHGFFQHRKIAGHLRYGHNGGTDYFHSEMGIYPELDFAILISSNTTTGKAFNKAIETAIVEHVFGTVQSPLLKRKTNEPTSSDLSRFTGAYVDTRRPQSNIEVLVTFSQPSILVTQGEYGGLIINYGDERFTALEIAPKLFEDLNNNRHFEFVENEYDAITHLKSLGSFDRVATYQTPENRLLSLLITVAFIVFTLVVGLIRSMKRYTKCESSLKKNARKHLLFSVAMWAVFIILLMIGLVHDIGEYAYPYSFPSAWVIAALTFGLLATLTSMLPAYSMYSIWRVNEGSLVYRLMYSLRVAVIALLVLQLNALHLIGFNYF